MTTATMGSNIVAVDFGADTIWAIDQGGTPYVAITPICTVLGLNPDAQRRRIQGDAVMAEGHAVMVLPSPGGPQKTLCLRLDLLNGWLFSIDERRVKPAARDTVLRYKRECYRALFEHFYGEAARPRPGDRRRIAAAEALIDKAKVVALLHQHQLRVLAAIRGLGQGASAEIARLAALAGLSEQSTCRHMGLLYLLGLVDWSRAPDRLEELIGLDPDPPARSRTLN